MLVTVATATIKENNKIFNVPLRQSRTNSLSAKEDSVSAKEDSLSAEPDSFSDRKNRLTEVELATMEPLTHLIRLPLHQPVS